jgi:serine carboxypeptidase-like clade I
MWFRSRPCALWGTLLFYSSVTVVVHAAPLEDLVEFVPGYGRPPTTQFSGFLNATEGCDTSINGNYCYLHYWLAMADMGDNDDKSGEDVDVNAPPPPVILWLNGGPGSSSILGWLTELGPLLMNATGGLMKNPYSWTKAPAHVLALEAPVGVGYSYCERQVTENKPCQNTDRYTASASRAAMVDFFTNKFPELQSSDFYITGESYAGVYM